MPDTIPTGFCLFVTNLLAQTKYAAQSDARGQALAKREGKWKRFLTDTLPPASFEVRDAGSKQKIIILPSLFAQEGLLKTISPKSATQTTPHGALGRAKAAPVRAARQAHRATQAAHTGACQSSQPQVSRLIMDDSTLTASAQDCTSWDGIPQTWDYAGTAADQGWHPPSY